MYYCYCYAVNLLRQNRYHTYGTPFSSNTHRIIIDQQAYYITKKSTSWCVELIVRRSFWLLHKTSPLPCPSLVLVSLLSTYSHVQLRSKCHHSRHCNLDGADGKHDYAYQQYVDITQHLPDLHHAGRFCHARSRDDKREKCTRKFG